MKIVSVTVHPSRGQNGVSVRWSNRFDGHLASTSNAPSEPHCTGRRHHPLTHCMPNMKLGCDILHSIGTYNAVRPITKSAGKATRPHHRTFFPLRTIRSSLNKQSTFQYLLSRIGEPFLSLATPDSIAALPLDYQCRARPPRVVHRRRDDDAECTGRARIPVPAPSRPRPPAPATAI